MSVKRRLAFVRGVLWAGAPASWVLLDLAAAAGGDPDWIPAVALALRCGAATVIGAAGVLISRRQTWGRGLATVGLAIGLVAAGPALLSRPAAALAVGATLILLWTRLWSHRSAKAAAHGAAFETLPEQHALLKGTLVVGGALLLATLMTDGLRSPAGRLLSLVTATIVHFTAMRTMRLRRRRWTWWVLGPGIVLLAGAGIGPHAPRAALAALLVWPFAQLLRLRWITRSAGMTPSPLWDVVTAHPARLMAASFLATALAGSVALSLPVAHTAAKGLAFVDAAFTAFSAVCVTGLVVVDTPTAYSWFGELVILLLIQLGGLGIMTFATIALHLAGRRVGLAQESAMASLLGEDSRAAIYDSARTMLRLTVLAELSGAFLLAAGFVSAGDPLGTATWRGLFTAVSAYCNAGFALQTTSLVPYREHAFILLTTSLLIVLGGLGPLLVVATPGWVRRRPTPLVVKLGLVTTVALLASSFLLIASLEWSRTLSGLGVGDKLMNAWFQAVTLRTAGFNSIDLTGLHPATFSLMLAMMFVGGCPGGTAGGIKTTTMALLLLTVSASLRGKTTPTAFGRRVAPTSLMRATAVATLAVLLIAGGVLLIGLTQSMPWKTAVFEVVSATGTVGLSIGGTAALDGVGKIVIVVCMFAGRVGPLTLFLLVGGGAAAQRWTAPAEEVAVG